MFKKLTFAIAILMIATASFSNTAIFAKHKDKAKNGAKVNCIYCHAGASKIEKKKGQIKDKKLNGVSLAKNQSCNGAGCHK